MGMDLSFGGELLKAWRTVLIYCLLVWVRDLRNGLEHRH